MRIEYAKQDTSKPLQDLKQRHRQMILQFYVKISDLQRTQCCSIFYAKNKNNNSSYL